MTDLWRPPLRGQLDDRLSEAEKPGGCQEGLRRLLCHLKGCRCPAERRIMVQMVNHHTDDDDRKRFGRIYPCFNRKLNLKFKLCSKNSKCKIKVSQN